MFIPLAKADAAQRLVYGYFDETPDRAREVCDYATARPAFEAWSAEMSKASDGKSFGNIRGQHSNIAAGKLIDLTFDDDLKKIGFVAKVVDDNEWRKVEEGVYTGFSPGGRYAKRWKDGDLTRYTPEVKELSIVDVPCNPGAAFTMVKANGAEEQVSFVVDKAYEPGNEATVERATALAKAAGKDGRKNDFLGKARAELIAEQASETLAKMDAAPVEKPDPVAALDAVLAKAAGIGGDAKTSAPDFDALAHHGGALKLLAKSVDGKPLLAKGMYTLERVGCLLERIGEIATSVAWEEKSENDTDSNLPQMAIDLVGKVRDFLIEMANEETAELLTSIQSNMPELDLVIIDGDDMELAVQIVDLVKADTCLMEKAGARNSKADKTTIQDMHDGAVKLGADCGGPAEKDALSDLRADRDRLAKAFDAAVPKVEALTERLEAMASERDADRAALTKAQGEIELLKAQPMPPKGALRAVEKEVGSETLEKADNDLDSVPAGSERTRAINAHARTLLAQR